MASFESRAISYCIVRPVLLLLVGDLPEKEFGSISGGGRDSRDYSARILLRRGFSNSHERKKEMLMETVFVRGRKDSLAGLRACYEIYRRSKSICRYR